MFISSASSFRVRNDLNLQKDDILESIFIETCLKENDKIIIRTIYRPDLTTILMTLKQILKLFFLIKKTRPVY